uniref:Ig-like domain-containing protein n=2 Tax=Cyprinus carpio TaxID=7962 RepID=A0A8C1UE00_CYPCA
MKILLIFLTFYLISAAVRCFSVTGYSGGSVLVDPGKPWFSANVKCMNKLPEWTNIMNNTKHDKWINVGKFTLFQNNEGNLMIYIRDLKEHDAGGYWIGVLYKWGIDMTLHVEEDSCCKVSRRVMVNIGETANFSCEYLQNHINNPKIIFKEEKDSIETIYSKWKKKERFSISDDKHKKIFSVKITAVTPDDGGVYLCGVWISGDSYSYSIINTIHLHVMMPPVVRHEGESAEIICSYDSIYKSKPKSLCKGTCSTRDRSPLSETVREENETKTGRLTLNDDITAGVFTGTITGLTAEDAGKYWCAVTLETELNYLYTHLIVIMNEELNLTKYEGDDVSIQCKHHDEDQKIFCKAHETSMCVKDGVSLETIRDDRFSFSDEASTGVFTVKITDLREEDSGIYWCGAHVTTKVHLNISKDFSVIIIISVCVILLLIAGFTLTVCKLRHKRQGETHTQLPTIPSDELLYAAVSFQKHEESLSEATVRFSEEEVYTTVIYHTGLN